MLGSQVGADRGRVLGAFADDPGFTVKADLPGEGVGWDPAWPPQRNRLGPCKLFPESGGEEGNPRVCGPHLSDPTAPNAWGRDYSLSLSLRFLSCNPGENHTCSVPRVHCEAKEGSNRTVGAL